MAQLESIDGKKYNVPDDVLARYKISDDKVGQLIQHDDLPVAPPPQEGWDNYNEPMPPQQQMAQSLEDNPFVRMQRGPNNELIINVVVPGVQ